MLIIAERINSSRKKIAAAIASVNVEFIQEEAKTQDLAGADYIEVNAGTFVGAEREKLQWVIQVVQDVTDKPLCIDSPDPKVIADVLPSVKRTPIINSITLEPARMENLLPLVVEYKAKVIALCQSERMTEETAEAKVALADKILERLTKAGVPLDDIYLDPLLYPLSTNSQSARVTLDAIGTIMKRFPGVHTVCGLTNVSFGLPARKLINRAFLAAAIMMGLDAAIIDPTDRQLYSMLKAITLVVGKDDFCTGYIKAFREGRIE